MKLKRVFVIAGEASGDVYAGQVVAALKALQPDLMVQGWGGEQLEAAGAVVTQHYRDLAFMGFWEVLKNLRTIARNLDRCWKEMLAFQPDVVLGVDFPGFNLRIARKAKSHGLPYHHYISPSVWAWKKGRIRHIKRDIERLYLTLPFEVPLYQEVGMDAPFVGHPLLDVVAEHRQFEGKAWRSSHGLDARPIVALLPGSRTQELRHMLPVLVEAAQRMGENVQPVIAGAPGQEPQAYAAAPYPVLFGQTQALLQQAQCAVVTSGTATLEAALYAVPQVIVYRTSALTYAIAKRLAQVDFIGLPNLLLQRLIAPELIQKACTPTAIAAALRPLLEDSTERLAQLAACEEIGQLLGTEGASRRVAQHLLSE